MKKDSPHLEINFPCQLFFQVPWSPQSTNSGLYSQTHVYNFYTRIVLSIIWIILFGKPSFFYCLVNDFQFSGKLCFPWLQSFYKKISKLFISHFIVVLNKTTTRPSRPKPSRMPTGDGMGTGSDQMSKMYFLLILSK